MAVNVATFNETVDLRGKTFCCAEAGVAIGSDAAKVQLAASNGAGVDYVIDGLFYHKADADDLWTLSGTALAVSQACIFGLLLNSAGTASIVQGSIVSTADVTNGVAEVPWPVTPVSKCMVGAVLVETNASVTFTPGTTDLSATGITDTYFNFPVPPSNGLNADHMA